MITVSVRIIRTDIFRFQNGHCTMSDYCSGGTNTITKPDMLAVINALAEGQGETAMYVCA